MSELSSHQFQTALLNDSSNSNNSNTISKTDDTASKDGTMVDGCFFYPVLEQERQEQPEPPSPPPSPPSSPPVATAAETEEPTTTTTTMTPLESIFAQDAVKRNRQAYDYSSNKRARRYRRIPCKARGIASAYHNSDTAFFDIPTDANHGMLLSCSHPECSGSGRRFRWCNVCEMPFAKRNFLKRHGHNVMHSSRELHEDDMDNALLCQVISSSSSSSRLPPPHVPPPPQDYNNNDGHHQQVSNSINHQVSNSINNHHHQVVNRRRRPHHRRVISFDRETGAKRNNNNNDDERVSDNEQSWLDLLKHRPKKMKDSKEMTLWMSKVISFTKEEKKYSRPSSFQIAPVVDVVEAERAFMVSPDSSTSSSSASSTTSSSSSSSASSSSTASSTTTTSSMSTQQIVSSQLMAGAAASSPSSSMNMEPLQMKQKPELSAFMEDFNYLSTVFEEGDRHRRAAAAAGPNHNNNNKAATRPIAAGEEDLSTVFEEGDRHRRVAGANHHTTNNKATTRTNAGGEEDQVETVDRNTFCWSSQVAL